MCVCACVCDINQTAFYATAKMIESKFITGKTKQNELNKKYESR